MTWHVLSSSHFDFDEFHLDSKADLRPVHLVPSVNDALGGELHHPDADDDGCSFLDRVGGSVYGRPSNWAAARRLVKKLDHGDAVYATGDDAGVPLGILLALRRKKVSIAIHFVDSKRTRTRVFGWLLAFAVHRLLILVTLEQQREDALATFGRKAEGVIVVKHETDTAFFRPPDTRSPNSPPMLTSCGAEQRDYATFAEAIERLDLDEIPTARVCLASPNLSNRTRYTMPDPVPENMDFRYYAFDKLRVLYQTADLLVLPLMDNRYSAGLTTLLEAIACGCPVIAANIPGDIARLISMGLVVGYTPGDADDLSKKIAEVLAEPEAAAKRAEQARAELLLTYSTKSYLTALQTKLSEFHQVSDRLAQRSS